MSESVCKCCLLQWQVVQPALVPPPPFKGYVRGITTKTTEMLLHDLQAEGKRLRDDLLDNSGEQPEPVKEGTQEDMFNDHLKHCRKFSVNRRKPRKSRWRQKEEDCP
jgi:hypothetical protein